MSNITHIYCARGGPRVVEETASPQPDLLSLLADAQTDGADERDSPLTAAAKFERFHADNPRVYATLCRLAREWIARMGRRKVGIAALYEVTRWEIALATNDPDFKVNNDYRAYYSRLLMANEPDLSDLFDLRQSAADEWIGGQAA